MSPATDVLVRDLCLPGQRRLHIKNESDSRSGMIIKSREHGGSQAADRRRRIEPMVERVVTVPGGGNAKPGPRVVRPGTGLTSPI